MIADQGLLVSFGRSRQATREMRMGSIVSENFFNALHVQPMLGRGFRPEEGQVPGRDAVVVLGYDFWKNVLGSDPSILNSTVVLNGIDFQVIGVLPESFPGLDQFFRPTLYVPMAMLPRLANSAPSQLENREQRTLQVRARLRSGVSRDAAQAEMTALWTALQRQYPDANNNRVIAVRTEFERRLRASPPNAVLTALNSSLASIVLIIACANVANLLLGRARARSREMAIRLALGVGRVRLLKQLLTESLLLALLGGVFGIGLAYAGIRFMAAGAQAVVPTDVPAVVSPQLDARALSLQSPALSSLVSLRHCEVSTPI
jgi:putative ABC transport system permease protein